MKDAIPSTLNARGELKASRIKKPEGCRRFNQVFKKPTVDKCVGHTTAQSMFHRRPGEGNGRLKEAKSVRPDGLLQENVYCLVRNPRNDNGIKA